MKKTILLLALMSLQLLVAQEDKKEPAFSIGPMVRVHGIYPINFGDNYLADSNDPKVSIGLNMSFFDIYGFRLAVGVDHIFYNTNNLVMAGDVSRSKYMAIYGTISYDIPIANKFSAQPYLGAGWAGIRFKRAGEHQTSNYLSGLNDYGVSSQEGSEFRAGFYLDYKVAKIVSVYTGLNYVRTSYGVDTAAEFEDYFGKSSTMQINLGLKIGYSLRDKSNAKAQILNN